MSTWENKVTQVQGVHYSRYIASWTHIALKQMRYKHASRFMTFHSEEFKEWLKANCCTDDEINDICNMAECGKLELEGNCGPYVERWITPAKGS